jgi:outer membrane receptor protein involved in Fe transport
LGLVTTLGGFYNITDSQAQLFNDSTYLYQNAAIYGQLEKQFSGKLIASLGLRYEYNDQKSPKEFLGITVPNGRVTDGQVVARAGINYKLADFTNLRASWGQGYRYPTVTERFIRTSFGGFQIFPNPLLTPEYGFSTEVAVKQGIKVGGIMGFLDVSGFWQQYTDMIEFSFIASGTNFGFKPINVGNTRITGTEVSFMGKFKVGPVDFTTLTGYTYIVPVYLNFDENPQIRSSVSSGVNELKYRSRHSAKSDIEGSFEGLTIGFAWQRYSHMVNIDKQIEEPLIGQDLFEIKAFRKLNPNGFNTFDFRLGYALGQFKLSAILANATNQLYTIRPGLAEAPKNYTLRLDYDF